MADPTGHGDAEKDRTSQSPPQMLPASLVDNSRTSTSRDSSIPSEKAIRDLSLLIDRRAEQLLRAWRRESREQHRPTTTAGMQRLSLGQKSSTLGLITISVASIAIALTCITHDSLGDLSMEEPEDWTASLLFEAFLGSLVASIGFAGIAASESASEEESDDRLLSSLFVLFCAMAVVSFFVFSAGLRQFAWHAGYASVHQTALFCVGICFAFVVPLRFVLRTARSV